MSELPAVPKIPTWMSYVENRRQPYKIHNKIGHASNSIRMNACVTDEEYLEHWDGEYDDEYYERRYAIGYDSAIYQLADGEWVLRYLAPRGMNWFDRPWRDVNS